MNSPTEKLKVEREKKRLLKSKLRTVQKKLQRKETAALLVLQKKLIYLRECQGHLTSQKDRDQILSLISEAKQAGTCYCKACEILNLHPRTLQRWQNKSSQKDRRV